MSLYAKIKPTSKYYDQNLEADELPFPVFIDGNSILGENADIDNYCVKGGPGGQYKLYDVELYLKRFDGALIKLNQNESPDVMEK